MIDNKYTNATICADAYSRRINKSPDRYNTDAAKMQETSRWK